VIENDIDLWDTVPLGEALKKYINTYREYYKN